MKFKKILLNLTVAFVSVTMLNCYLTAFATEVSEQVANKSTEETVENYGWEADPFDRLALEFENNIVELSSSYDP